MYNFHPELYTHNPIKGKCSHNCEYCYMLGLRERYLLDDTLRINRNELKQGLGSDRFVFVGSSTDMFAEDVPSEWIEDVLTQLNRYPQNQYLLQSKNPARFLDFLNHPLLVNHSGQVIFCTTVESDKDFPEISDAPRISARIDALRELNEKGFRTMITVEPIMAFSNPVSLANLITSVNPEQVNIGANTASWIPLIEPTKEEVLTLINELNNRGIKIHLKDNLDRLIK